MTTSLVATHYNANASLEHNRLISGKLEFTITLNTILNCLPKTPTSLKIADISGGTGRYTVELAKLGQSITLIDISQSELAPAAEHAAASNITLASVHCADASKLLSTLPNLQPQLASFDIILLLGPLYHLLEESDRVSTVAQCAKLLKPEGTLFASFLTRFGHLRGVALKDPGRLAREPVFYARYLEDGKYTRREGIVSQHVHTSEIPGLFEEVNTVEGSGLHVEKMIACEGFLGAEQAERLNALSDEEWKAWVDVLVRFAGDGCVFGASEHVLAVARKM